MYNDEWNECVEEAKEELGINGWTEQWSEVINLAKEKYWNGDSFKNMKRGIINESNKECKLCGFNKSLTIHHIFYGNTGYENCMCVCKDCHSIIHKLLKKYGFILQLLLKDYDDPNLTYIKYNCPNLLNIVLRCNDELINMINKKDEDKGLLDKEIG